MPGAKLQEGAGSCEDGSVDPVCVCTHSSCSGDVLLLAHSAKITVNPTDAL